MMTTPAIVETEFHRNLVGVASGCPETLKRRGSSGSEGTVYAGHILVTIATRKIGRDVIRRPPAAAAETFHTGHRESINCNHACRTPWVSQRGDQMPELQSSSLSP